MIVLSGCASEIITTSSRNYSVAQKDVDNMYILPEKILKATVSYEIEEEVDEKQNFKKTLSCRIKDDISIETFIIPDYSEQFVLRNKKQNKMTVKIQNCENANGILSTFNSEVVPEGAEILNGVVGLAGALIKTAVDASSWAEQGIMRIKLDDKSQDGDKENQDTDKTRKRIVKLSQFINPDKLPFKTNLAAPVFPDTFKFDGFVELNLSTEYLQPGNLPDVAKQIKNSNASYEGIIYRLPIPVKVQVLATDKKNSNNQQVINDIVYFPQFGQYEVAPTNVDYGLFAGKRTVLIAFNQNTGGLQKTETIKESAIKEVLEGGKSAATMAGATFDYIKEKQKIDADYEKQFSELDKQIKLLELQKKLKELKEGNR